MLSKVVSSSIFKVFCNKKESQTWLNCHYKFISLENIIVSVLSDDFTLDLRLQNRKCGYVYVYTKLTSHGKLRDHLTSCVFFIGMYSLIPIGMYLVCPYRYVFDNSVSLICGMNQWPSGRVPASAYCGC